MREKDRKNGYLYSSTLGSWKILQPETRGKHKVVSKLMNHPSCYSIHLKAKATCVTLLYPKYQRQPLFLKKNSNKVLYSDANNKYK